MKYKLIILIVIFNSISCKKNITDITFNQNCLKNRITNSVFQTCGGSCTVTYLEKKISIVDSLIKVDYNAKMYIYEELEDEFKGVFFVRCNKENKASFIYFEDSPNDNILDVKVNSLSESFQVYSDELCDCISLKKIDIEESKKHQEKQFITKSSAINLKQVYDKSKIILLPFSNIDDSDFKKLHGVFIPELEGLDGLEIVKLPLKNRVNNILIRGYSEIGESRLYLMTLNNLFVPIDNIEIASYEEIDEGGISTTFEINKKHQVSIIKKEIIQKRKRILDTKNYKITENGKIIEFLKNRNSTILIASVDNLRVRKTPKLKGEEIELLPLNYQVIYLGEKSKSQTTVTVNGENITDYWYKVKTPKGNIGWVHGCCVSKT